MIEPGDKTHSDKMAGFMNAVIGKAKWFRRTTYRKEYPVAEKKSLEDRLAIARTQKAQAIARADAKLARLEKHKRAKETREKIIVGGAIIAEAQENAAVAALLLAALEKAARPQD